MRILEQLRSRSPSSPLRLKTFALMAGFVFGQQVLANTNCTDSIIALTKGTDYSTEDFSKIDELFRDSPHFFTPLVRDGHNIFTTHFNSPIWAEIFPRETVLTVFGNFEGSIRAEELSKLLNSIKDSQQFSNISDTESARSLVSEKIQALLDLSAPRSQISYRAAQFLQSPNPDTLKRAVGVKTLDEVSLLVHGGDFRNPTPESLMGRYLEESNAKKIIRGFPSDVEETSALGPEKLAVAISTSNGSGELFQKYFYQPEFLYHYHTPSQGTLYFLHHGLNGNYARYTSAMDASRPSEGTILPMILLSSKEAERARLYFSLGMADQNLSKLPWEFSNYCAKGGYTSCTHWWGEMPLGEDLVDSYRFPGNADRWAGNATSEAPQEAPLQAIDPNSENFLQKATISSNDGLVWKDTAARSAERVQALARSVWKAPGNKQLWEMLGLRDGLDAGELANPGWVARDMTGKTDASRVPIVFVYRASPDEELTADFPTHVSAH